MSQLWCMMTLAINQGRVSSFRQSFYDRGHFCNALKEFSILNNFELEHTKPIVEGSRANVCPNFRRGVCMHMTGAQFLTIRKFCNKHT